MVKDFNFSEYLENFPKNSSHKQTSSITPADYQVEFSGISKSYCVGIINIVNSIKTSTEMDEISWSKYYGIFVNSIAKILPRFGGVIIKNLGDSLLFYFPESSKGKKYGFLSCLECGLALIEEHFMISKSLVEKGLPFLDYRVSADYGKVVLMKSNNSSTQDLIGPPVNMCSKINLAAKTNEMVIGGDLYSMVRGINDFKFKEVKGFSLGFKNPYPVYRLERRKK